MVTIETIGMRIKLTNKAVYLLDKNLEAVRVVYASHACARMNSVTPGQMPYKYLIKLFDFDCIYVAICFCCSFVTR